MSIFGHPFTGWEKPTPELIKHIIESKNVSYKMVARAVGVQVQTVYAWTRDRQMEYPYWRIFCEYFDLPRAKLYGKYYPIKNKGGRPPKKL